MSRATTNNLEGTPGSMPLLFRHASGAVRFIPVFAASFLGRYSIAESFFGGAAIYRKAKIADCAPVPRSGIGRLSEPGP